MSQLNLCYIVDTPVSNNCGNGKLSPLFCNNENGGVVEEIIWAIRRAAKSTFTEPGCGG